MKISSRLLLPALLLGAPVTLAQAPAPQAPATAQQKTLDVNFRGSLRDAISQIYEQAGLNVVVLGNGEQLNQPVDLHLKGVTAEQALRTLAKSYSLKVENDNGIYTVRVSSGEEKQAVASATPPPGMPAMPPAPPVPPIPSVRNLPPPTPLPDDFDADELRDRVRSEMRKVRKHKGGRDVVARGHNLEVKENESVESAVVYGGNLIVKGHVEKDAVAFGGNLEVSGAVEGDAHAFGGNVILHPGAVVEGDVSSFGGTVERDENAVVEGSTESFGGANLGSIVAKELKEGLRDVKKNKHADEDSEDAEEHTERHGNGFPGFLLWFATLFGVGFLGQLFFPARMKELGTELRTQPLKSGVAGVLGTLALIPLSVLICITIIGIPVAILMWVVAIPLAAALGIAALASEIGMKLPVLRGRKTQAAVLALGLLFLLLLAKLPFLGPLSMGIAMLMGIGAVIRTRFGIRPKGMPEPIMSSSEAV